MFKTFFVSATSVLLLLVSLSVYSSTQVTSTETEASDWFRTECQMRINNGNYGSYQWEFKCKDSGEFDMPHAYLVKCVRLIREKENFSNPIMSDELTACDYFLSGENAHIYNMWGPWRDHTIPADLAPTFEKLKTLYSRHSEVNK